MDSRVRLAVVQTRSVASRQSSASSLRSAPEKGALRRTTSEDPEPKDSWDIFEPRVAAPQSAPADSNALEHKGGGCDLKELRHMTGKQYTLHPSDTITMQACAALTVGAFGWHESCHWRLCSVQCCPRLLRRQFQESSTACEAPSTDWHRAAAGAKPRSTHLT